MSEHLADLAEYVLGDDDSELAKTKAELAYALYSLEREIKIAQRCQAEVEEARQIIEDLLGLELGSGERALAFLSQAHETATESPSVTEERG